MTTTAPPQYTVETLLFIFREMCDDEQHNRLAHYPHENNTTFYFPPPDFQAIASKPFTLFSQRPLLPTTLLSQHKPFTDRSTLHTNPQFRTTNNDNDRTKHQIERRFGKSTSAGDNTQVLQRILPTTPHNINIIESTIATTTAPLSPSTQHDTKVTSIATNTTAIVNKWLQNANATKSLMNIPSVLNTPAEINADFPSLPDFNHFPQHSTPLQPLTIDDDDIAFLSNLLATIPITTNNAPTTPSSPNNNSLLPQNSYSYQFPSYNDSDCENDLHELDEYYYEEDHTHLANFGHGSPNFDMPIQGSRGGINVNTTMEIPAQVGIVVTTPPIPSDTSHKSQKTTTITYQRPNAWGLRVNHPTQWDVAAKPPPKTWSSIPHPIPSLSFAEIQKQEAMKHVIHVNDKPQLQDIDSFDVYYDEFEDY